MGGIERVHESRAWYLSLVSSATTTTTTTKRNVEGWKEGLGLGVANLMTEDTKCAAKTKCKTANGPMLVMRSSWYRCR